jgi:hypothetical protein
LRTFRLSRAVARVPYMDYVRHLAKPEQMLYWSEEHDLTSGKES